MISLYCTGPPKADVHCNVSINDTMLSIHCSIFDMSDAPVMGIIINSPGIAYNVIVVFTKPFLNTSHTFNDVVSHSIQAVSGGNYSLDVAIFNQITTVYKVYTATFTVATHTGQYIVSILSVYYMIGILLVYYQYIMCQYTVSILSVYYMSVYC